MPTVAHVLVLARARADPHLVARAPVEARGSVRVRRVAHLIATAAVNATPPVVTVGAVLAVDVELLKPRDVGADDRVFERVVLVARGAFAAVVAFEAAGTFAVGGVVEVRVRGDSGRYVREQEDGAQGCASALGGHRGFDACVDRGSMIDEFELMLLFAVALESTLT